MWTKPVRESLLWLQSFLFLEGSGPIRRVFTFAAHLNLGDPIRITTDASPWGIGGFIFVVGAPRAYLYDKISLDDQRISGLEAGSLVGQQCWECLAVLVALRLWKSWWHSDRVRLHVRADNITTLTMLRKLRVKGVGLTRISQDMALDIATATYEPDVLEHTPGIQNGVADMLSRVYDPSDKFKMPRYLENAVRVIPPERNQTYWLSVSPPCEPLKPHPAASWARGA